MRSAPVAANCLIALLCSGVAGAQQPAIVPQDLKRLSIEELTQVDITTLSRHAEPLAQAPAAVSVIRGEDIRRAGITNLADALRLADGVEAARADANTWAITTRGFNITTANKLLVLIDGRSVYSPLFGGQFWEVVDLPLVDVDRIEVIRGPGGTIWGANAVNGVVNIITKRASQTQGGSFLVGAGNEERLVATAQYGGAIGERDYRVYVKYRERDAQRRPDGASARDPLHLGAAGFRLESKAANRDSWTLQGDAYVGREGLPDRRDTRVAGGNILGRWIRRSSARAEFQIQTYYDHVSRDVFAQLNDVRDTFDVDAQQHARSGRHDVVFGAGFRLWRGRDTGNAAFFFDPIVRWTTTAGLFAQDEIALRPNRLFLIGGAKLERNTFSGWEPQPNVRLRWTPDARQTVWGAVSRAVRLPTRFDRDLRFTSPTGVVTLTGTPAFTTEKVTAYEAGYRGQLAERVSLDVATFVNRYDDLRSEELGLPVVLANRMNARTAGATIAGNLLLAPWWRTHASYSYLWEDFTFDPGSRDITRGVNEAQDPAHMFKLRSSVDLPHDVEADVVFRRVGAIDLPVVPFGPPSVPAYSELDARVGWRLRPAWDLSVIGQNLLHPRHAEFPLSNLIREVFERGAYIRLTWRY